MTTHTASTTISSPNGWLRYIKSHEELTHWFIAPQDNDLSPVLWKAVTGYSPRPSFKGETWKTWYGVGYDYPAYYIDYDDVQSFLKTLNKLTGVQFRMPTEAEWEFAAQGGNKTKYYIYSGSDNIDDVAWCKENSGSTSHPVKTKQPNELGLYDMSGNVWEWCSDWYDEYPSFDVTDPTGPVSGSKRVIRGGGWSNYATNCFTDLRHKANRYDTFIFSLSGDYDYSLRRPQAGHLRSQWLRIVHNACWLRQGSFFC